jgi:Raf kinase inhibitor-like YbhB/YbcL family protein
MALTVTSPVFTSGDSIPAKYTCDGKDTPPPLTWEGVPDSARSLALIVDDPDAPDPKAPKRTWIHWVMYNMPPIATGLPEGGIPLPAGTLHGKNDWKRTGYGGPCPPIGRHRYFFKLFALDTVLPDLGQPTAAELEKAMEGHIVERAAIMGMYERPK